MNSRGGKSKDTTVQGQLKTFMNQSMRFLELCTKPKKDGRPTSLLLEYFKMLKACLMGLAIMGVIGYVIKLVFIPINNIILGTS